MDQGRHALTVMVTLGALAATAGAKDTVSEEATLPDANAEEANAARETGLVLHDGKGHYLVFGAPDPARTPLGPGRAVFYGDGTTFYRQPIKAFGVDIQDSDLTAEWAILDERMGLDFDRSKLRLAHSRYTMTCRDSSTPMLPLDPAKARALLQKAAFKAKGMDREAYALGRDGTTYYFVDASSRASQNADYRVYVGKRGAMKLQKLTSAAADSKGAAFTLKTGTLRVTFKPRSLSWAPKPNKQVVLDTLPIERNLELVYNELGVYIGKKFGVPCDDL